MVEIENLTFVVGRCYWCMEEFRPQIEKDRPEFFGKKGRLLINCETKYRKYLRENVPVRDCLKLVDQFWDSEYEDGHDEIFICRQHLQHFLDVFPNLIINQDTK